MNSAQSGETMRAQGIRFVMFGAFNTAATFLVYCLLVFLMHPQIAYALVFALGIVVAYVGNSRFVFRQPLDWKIARVYPLVYLVQYTLTALLIYIFGTWLDVGPRVALAIALVITVPVSFTLNRALLSKAQHGNGTQ